MKKNIKKIKNIVGIISTALFIVLSLVSLICLIITIYRRVVGVDLEKAICYVNGEKLEFNINYAKKLNEFEYEIKTDDGFTWIINENHCQLIERKK